MFPAVLFHQLLILLPLRYSETPATTLERGGQVIVACINLRRLSVEAVTIEAVMQFSLSRAFFMHELRLPPPPSSLTRHHPRCTCSRICAASSGSIPLSFHLASGYNDDQQVTRGQGTCFSIYSSATLGGHNVPMLSDNGADLYP